MIIGLLLDVISRVLNFPFGAKDFKQISDNLWEVIW